MLCGPTRKTVFKSHEAALIRGGEILNMDNNRRTQATYFTAYKCDFCGGYHLSGKHSEQLDKRHRPAMM